MMKGLFIQALAVFIFFSQLGMGQEKRIGFHLPSYPQTDLEMGSIQYFLFFHAFLELDPIEKGSSGFSYLPVGQLFINGEEEKVEECVIAFGFNLEKVILGELSQEMFKISKEKYIDFLKGEGEVDAIAFAEKLDLDQVLSFGPTLYPLPIMMQSMLPDTITWENDTIDDDEFIELSDSSPQLFYALRLTEEDQQNTSKMIKNLGDLGWIALWNDRKEMKKLGKKMKTIHPLRSMGFILSNPALKKRMSKVMGDMFKRKGFLNGDGEDEGFSQRMTREAHNNNLIQYLPGFAESLRVSQESIIKYFKKHDWEGLIFYLLKT